MNINAKFGFKHRLIQCFNGQYETNFNNVKTLNIIATKFKIINRVETYYVICDRNKS